MLVQRTSINKKKLWLQLVRSLATFTINWCEILYVAVILSVMTVGRVEIWKPWQLYCYTSNPLLDWRTFSPDDTVASRLRRKPHKPSRTVSVDRCTSSQFDTCVFEFLQNSNFSTSNILHFHSLVSLLSFLITNVKWIERTMGWNINFYFKSLVLFLQQFGFMKIVLLHTFWDIY